MVPSLTALLSPTLLLSSLAGRREDRSLEHLSLREGRLDRNRVDREARRPEEGNPRVGATQST